MNYTAEQINRAFNELDTNAFEALGSLKFDSKMSEIGMRYSLTGNSASTLKYYITMVIVKLINPKELPQIFEKELNLSNDVSENLAKELNISIFGFIDEYIKDKEENELILNQIEKEYFQEEKIPIPPYLQTETKTIEQPRVIENRPIEPVMPPVSKQESISTPEQIKTVEPIAQPLELNKAPNILEEKLSHPTVNTETVSNYSNPKVDPYRESF